MRPFFSYGLRRPQTPVFWLSFLAAPESVASICALTWMPIRVQRRKSTRGREPSDRAGNPAAKYDDVSTSPVSVLFDSWAGTYSQDPQWSSVYKQLQKDEYVRNCALYKGKIRCKGKLVVPKCLVRAVIAAMHAYSCPGQRKLDVLCRRRFLFPFSPKKLISEVIAQCPVCESCKAPNRSSADTLEHFPIPSTPFSSLAMDFVAAKSVVNALRHFLEERPGNWVEALPMALWGLNDLPGAVTPYSPHRLVFGRDPPGFEDTPPMQDWQGPEDALQFFERVS